MSDPNLSVTSFEPEPPPGPRLLHGFFDYHRDPPGFMTALFDRYGDVVRWRPLGTIYLINDPDDVRRVLTQAWPQFSKRTIDYRILAVTMGQGLVTSDGEQWAAQRRLMQPMFNNRAINPFAEPINARTAALAARWSRLPPGHVVALETEMSRLTFEVVGATLFGADIERHADEMADILEVVNVHTHEPRALLLALCPWLPTRFNRRIRQAIARLDGIVYGLIEARRRSGERRLDLLDRLLYARDEASGSAMDQRQIRDEVVTLMLAGHETSANALVWTFYLLARHAEVEARLLAELDAVLGGRPATASDLARLPYLKQVVQESMRIYPPVWALARRCHQPEIFQGQRIPADSYLVMLPFALHRHPGHWPEPERFDPMRFDPGRAGKRHSYCYLPFGAGPRTCIGAGMAMLEIQLVLAQLLPRFALRPLPGQRVETLAKVTLKPRHGMPMRVLPRTAAEH